MSAIEGQHFAQLLTLLILSYHTFIISLTIRYFGLWMPTSQPPAHCWTLYRLHTSDKYPQEHCHSETDRSDRKPFYMSFRARET